MSETIKFRIDIEGNGEKILKTLNLSVDDFNDLIENTVKQCRKLSTSFSKLAQGAVVFNAFNTAVEQTQDLLVGLIEDFNAFDKSMRAVNTMAGENKKGLDALTVQVEDLARVIPLAKTELANGLYQVISNGVPKDNWISFLEASAKSAVGGIADLGQTVTVTSTIIKNYGLEWDAAASIQDKIQMTAKNGVTSFEQLGQALPRVTGNAATLGVSVDELMASFATLTGVSGNTAEVSTQLAAIFTALVKPSSEAAEMASQMGLKFNAAAIKASGGMQQFLQTLTSTVEEYATTHGMLEQEIYGRLFGSAEALRALIPITGELSDTFNMNVESMAGSAGTIDQAFEDMAGSGEAAMQLFKNSMSTMFSWAGGIASSIQPMLTFVAVSGQSIYSLKMLKETSLQALSGIKALIPAKRALIVVTAKLNRTLLRNPYIAIIAGVLALGSAIYALVTAESAAEKAAKQMAVASEQIQTTVDGEITKLGYLWKALENSTKGSEQWKTAKDAIVNQYGQYFTDLDTEIEKVGNLSGLYDQLTKAVEKSIRARELSNYIKENDPRQSSGEKMADLYKSLKDMGGDDFAKRIMPKMRNAINAGNGDITKWGINAKDMKRLFGSDALGTAVEMAKGQSAFNKNLKDYMTANGLKESDVFKAVTGVDIPDPTDTTPQTKPIITKDKAWYEQEKQAAEKELAALTEIEAKGKKGAALRTKIANYQRIIDTTWGTGNKNTGGNSKSDGRRNAVVNAREQYDEQMSGTLASWDSQMADLNVASMDEGTDKEIAQIKRDAKRKKAALDEAISELVAKKKEQEKALWLSQNPDKAEADWKPQKSDAEYRNDVLNENDYALLTKYYDLCNKINTEEAQRLKAYEAPGRVEELNTLSELGKAISYYEEQQSRASGEEVVNIQRTIDALRAKEDALKRLTELPGMGKEVADLGKLSGQQLKMELELIGVDGIKGKIRDLQKMLDDTENPLNDNERKVVSGLISEWRGYEVQLRKSQLKMTDAWDNIKGIGNGVTGLTETLRGNGTAWEKIVGVVDGVIGLYQSFSGIVGIISLLTQATQVQAVAEGVKATATLASAGAETTATTAEVTASGITTAAIVAETSAWSALAAAKTFAAHAFMPFVGTGIAAGFIATQQAVIAAAAIPVFANGGIAYGPTLGLFGEYAGAKSNPEVVAPLDRLRSLMGVNEPTGGGGRVEFKIEGRTLVGMLDKMERYNKRT